ncbi:hypothetical protein EXIGLDRAFT_695822 [Exidia glandulosa HHB12029]|uniref:Uncharacterized protein n=1 Tax=Exidia glandulosa HHB12029 TaxID=1314781 RepID=A0A165FKE2_EXIGL|nr:hypothetical protein EXIGLDRAFT_695822 [Exidia glandulosa HHB12029]
MSRRARNVTIDDMGGDGLTGAIPSYVATGNASPWRIRPADPCSLCKANPDGTRIHLGTWHDGTYEPGGGSSTVSFFFTGRAIYIYGILTNSVPGNNEIHLQFHIDGSPVGRFDRKPDTSSGAPTYVYNQVVYANSSLVDSGEHNFLIVNGGGSEESLFLFDYAVYTTTASIGDDTQSTTTSETAKFHSAASASSGQTDFTSSPSANRVQTIAGSTTSIDSGSGSIPTAAPPPDSLKPSTKVTVIAATTTTVTILAIAFVICIVQRRRRRRRNQTNLFPTR